MLKMNWPKERRSKREEDRASITTTTSTSLAILLTQFPSSFPQKIKIKEKKRQAWVARKTLFLSLHLHSLPRFLFVAKKKLLLPNKKENLHKVNTHTDTGKIAITLARYLLLAAPSSLASLLFSCSVGPCLNSCRHQSSNAFKILRCCCNFIADTRERSNVVVVECLLLLCCAGYTLTKKVLTGSTRLGWRTRKKTEHKKTAEIVLGKSFSQLKLWKKSSRYS